MSACRGGVLYNLKAFYLVFFFTTIKINLHKAQKRLALNSPVCVCVFKCINTYACSLCACMCTINNKYKYVETTWLQFVCMFSVSSNWTRPVHT